MHYIEKSNSKNRYTLSKLKNKKKLPYNGVCVKRFLVEVYGLPRHDGDRRRSWS